MSTFRKLAVFTKSSDFKTATKLVEVPLISPEPHEIRVRQIYAGVNATDMNMTAARSRTGALPFDVGFEALGVVDAIGSSIQHEKISIGQPVLVFDSGNSSGFSEYSYKPLESLFPVPEVKPEYLATLINGLTASIALDKCGHVKVGEKVLVTAAAGGTGQIVVQWAKQRGAYVIAITSSSEKAKFLKDLGADLVINYREEDLDQVLSEKFSNGIDIIWETIGGLTFTMLFKHLAVRGRLILVGAITTYKDGSTTASIENLHGQLLRGAKTLTAFHLSHYFDYLSEYLPKLIRAIEQGEIKVQVDLGQHSEGGHFFGLDQVWRAQEWLHSGRNVGKVVVQLQNV